MTMILLISGAIVWMLIGCVVFAAIDTQDKRLYRWYASPRHPLISTFGPALILLMWPYVAIRFSRA